MVFKVDLDSASAKKVGAKKSVDRMLAGAAEALQVDGEIFGGECHSRRIYRNGVKPVSPKSRVNAEDIDCASETQAKSFRRAGVEDANTST